MAEIAQAFLVPETTMAQRITRAKKKISAAKVPYRVPAATDLPERLGGVLTVLFLVFNEGYLATGGGDPVRAELTGEAIRLARVLRHLLPDEPEVAGLLALLLLTEARRAARVRDGQLVPLGEQDRAGWDHELIAEGHHLVRECLAINRPGRYQILAAINAVHTDAGAASDTDWSQVVALYDQLTRLDPSPIVALNRAVAVAELDGPQVALTLIDRAAAAGLPRLARRPRRLPAPARPDRRSQAGLRRRHRGHPELRRACLPEQEARRAGLSGSLVAGPMLGGMAIQHMHHVSVIVDDLESAVAFFVELGMEVEGRASVEGDWVDRINALDGVRVDMVMVRTPDGHSRLELTKFHTPAVLGAGPGEPVNTLGLRTVMFAVDDLDDVLTRLRPHGGELVGEVVQHADIYRLCYVRGPAGIIVALAEQLG